jgi:hypothetical protein
MYGAWLRLPAGDLESPDMSILARPPPLRAPDGPGSDPAGQRGRSTAHPSGMRL